MSKLKQGDTFIMTKEMLSEEKLSDDFFTLNLNKKMTVLSVGGKHYYLSKKFDNIPRKWIDIELTDAILEKIWKR